MINELCNSDFLMVDNKSKANARKNFWGGRIISATLMESAEIMHGTSTHRVLKDVQVLLR